VKKRKKTTKKGYERTKGRERIADAGAPMKKRKKKPDTRHECDEGREMIARYMRGDEDGGLTRKLLLHAQTCTECATLLRSLKRLVHYCSIEPNCDMPVTVRRELWVTIRRDATAGDAECRECTELHESIAGYACGELDEEATHELIRHLQSCPQCARLLRGMRWLDRVIRELRPIPDMPDVPDHVHNVLWETLRRRIADNLRAD
jgi:hypothetical protein